VGGEEKLAKLTTLALFSCTLRGEKERKREMKREGEEEEGEEEGEEERERKRERKRGEEEEERGREERERGEGEEERERGEGGGEREGEWKREERERYAQLLMQRTACQQPHLLFSLFPHTLVFRLFLWEVVPFLFFFC
jgi:hypothetical protein